MDSLAKLQATLDEADAKGYGLGAWYFYMDRRDIEGTIAEVLSLRLKVAGLETGMAIMESRVNAPPTA